MLKARLIGCGIVILIVLTIWYINESKTKQAVIQQPETPASTQAPDPPTTQSQPDNGGTRIYKGP